ncbi:MAG: rod shape-determining protein MreB, rod shape-determining protein MreB [candidate division WWE3 bacterium GW2011_GWC1_47_10]|uniref:Cell shape-determining protein MreB n=1 Tax=candidate division WWE3 bacterium GW2011_GWC1_47_10 TaxID=1619122 RepID=A0A0G1R0D8_UNCKA|nr:MAG: rod shape-determining protein MreB, rod shape-determining protein MreB [candidate division WWE3 bacterium GW2011_GWC1_47_10]
MPVSPAKGGAFLKAQHATCPLPCAKLTAMLDRIFGLFSHDIGIDLGTANTLVYVKGKGILIREPSVVTIHKKTKEVLAVGAAAKRMLGKTPSTISAIRPLRDGVISDFYVTEKMLEHFIKSVHNMPSRFPKVPRPRVVIGVPSGVTSVEKKAVADAAQNAGARKAYLIEEPMAAAIGAGLAVWEPKGAMIVDMGGGTSEIAVISLGGMVVNKSLRVAGDEMDAEIVNFAKAKYNLLMGERTAEEIKVEAGNAIEFDGDTEVKVVFRGRDLKTGLPKSVEVSAAEVREALHAPVFTIINAVKDAIEETPAELVPDILKDGITLAGGTSLLKGLDRLMARELHVPVYVAKDPLTCVVRGCGMLLDDLALLERVRI